MLKVTPLGYYIQKIGSSVHILEKSAAPVLHYTTQDGVTSNKIVICTINAMRFHKI
jgi:hypothetical protein